MSERTFTLQDPACRNTIARMRAQFRRMRQLGIGRAVDGARLTTAAKTDVRKTIARARKALAGRKAA